MMETELPLPYQVAQRNKPETCLLYTLNLPSLNMEPAVSKHEACGL